MNSSDNAAPDISAGLNVRIGIHTSGAPILSPRGDYHIHRENDCVIYEPLREDAFLALENQLIGKDFHWERLRSSFIPGKVEVARNASGKWEMINEIPLEKYIMCVIGSEMNPDAPAEFLKAHAIISRSWALGKILGLHRHDSEGKFHSDNLFIDWEDSDIHTGYHLCSDDHCQRYQGLSENAEKMKDIVEATARLVIFDSEGNIADARYSKCCGGVTELFSSCWQPADYPYLVAKEDENCNLDSLPLPLKERLLSSILKDYDMESASSFMNWEERVSRDLIKRRLLELTGKDIGNISDMRVIERGPSSRAIMMELIGDKGRILVGKELLIRRILSPSALKSSLFTIDRDGEDFIIHGRGWGHGVGLCQIGAARMALEGATCEEILSFYYPSSNIGIYDSKLPLK